MSQYPRATLRLQFHRDFTLDDALPLLDYFAALGISHLYASPLLTARAGSMHGYDVVDPTRINPELGGEDALRRLVAGLRQRGMGLILDIVSNHMAVGGAHNPWWLDVLEWGVRSPYAKFFDIQWHSPDPLLKGQLLVPFLRSDYGEVLKAGEIVLRFDEAQGALYAEHNEHRFPLTPPSYGDLLRACTDTTLRGLAEGFAALENRDDAWQAAAGLRAELQRAAAEPSVRGALEARLRAYDGREAEGFERMHALLEEQHYRLASWRTAADDINWRRFFDINELGGLRVERAEVFEATHGKIFQLIEEGLVDGLRIDHVDGLADPRGYCRKLRRRVDALLARRPAEARLDYLPIYVEKILGDGESLRDDWGVDGTTGYEFMNQVSLLQHDPRGEAPLANLWNTLTGRPADFMEEVREARQLVLSGSLAGDFESVAQTLLQVAREDVMTRDLTLGAIRRALMALIVHFPVYRTYAGAGGRSAGDEPFFQHALEGARGLLAEVDWPLLDHLQAWLGGQPLHQLPPGRARKLRRHAQSRFQQLTSPAAAKAVEDTACYRSAVLLSRNDVGFDPQHFSAPIEDFHRHALARHEHFPGNLLTTATHDHKRGEDTRARLAVVSERAAWFNEKIQYWYGLAAPLREALADGSAPAPGDELMLYQTLLASWPLSLQPQDEAGLTAYAERVWRWQEKAIREAKLRSTWNAPNDAYEQACRAFLFGLLEGEAQRTLREDIAAAALSLAVPGALNGLVQTLLRMTAPGVPDLYQGTEFWDFSLVDPDNRQPVDYAARQASLDPGQTPAGLLANWRDAPIKQALIARTLRLRQTAPLLFERGEYLPLKVQGEHADKVIAFARRQERRWLLVIAPRLAASLLDEVAEPLVPAQRWGDTRVELPPALSGENLSGLFSHHAVTILQGSLALAEVLADFPVSVLISESYPSEEQTR
ncbi:malto-oligosyltrehalose synthase [Pseudomonas sp. RIT-PI-AD]|uniref:malto-oligosyltrehalose synthase n=1 Tax=Pseudomonas sp. RIT-PI-AD TaxID=3035294 RepID=UPI0021DA67AA|nr:malto-oligosyltrehalose synthase [Pseudomonas sp. RIT-PI-AD]